MKLLTNAITGSAQPRNIAAYLREPLVALEFMTTLAAATANDFIYRRIWAGTQALATNDVLTYDVWVDAMSAGLSVGGLEIEFSVGPTYGRAVPLVDQDGAVINVLAAARRGAWFRRTITIPVALNGSNMTALDLCNESENLGNSRVLYRNIRLLSSAGTIKATFWSSGVTQTNPPTTTASTAGYTVATVTPYAAPSWPGDPQIAAFNYGTDTGLRDGVWHEAGLSVFPEVSASGGDEFGIQSGGGFDVELAITPREFAPALEFKSTALGGPDAYVFWSVWSGAYVVVAGDTLRALVWADPKNPGLTTDNNFGLEVDFTTPASAGRAIPLRSQYNSGEYVGAQPPRVRGNWVEIHIDLAAIVGKTVNTISLFNEDNVVGAYRFMFRNIRITNATQSVTTLSIATGAHAINANVLAYQLLTTANSVVVLDAPVPLSVDLVSNSVIEFCNTAAAGANPYVYWGIWAGTVALSAGDLIQFEYWLDPSNPAFSAYESCGVQATHSAGAGGTNLIFTSAQPRGVWTAASFVINGGVSGGNLTAILLMNESDAAGNHRVLYRNVRVTTSTGSDRQLGWRSGNLSYNALVGANLQTVYGVNVIDQRLETQAERFDYSAMIANPKPWLGRQFDLELVSVLNRAGQPVSEITDVRRAVAKSVSRKGNLLKIGFADIDIAALSKTYPSRTHTTADFPALLPATVGAPITDGVGNLVRVPLTFISSGSGNWNYAVCEKITGMTYTLQTVYRGENANGVGRIVPSAEYTALADAGPYPSGLNVKYIAFQREQLNFSGQPYVLTADILINAGSGATEARLASNEIARLLALCGITTDPVSFGVAATYGVTNKMFCDAGYVKPRTFKAIIEDLLMICRCDLAKLSTGAWALVQDSPRTSAATFREDSDEITIDDYSFIDKPSTVSLYYRPEVSGEEKWNATPRTRTPGGTLPEKRYQNPYIRGDETADRLCDYLSKRDSIQQRATISAHAVQVAQREVVSVVGNTCWSGSKDWMVDNVRRPADKNVLATREYDVAIYTYTAVTLPTATSGVYSPDYSNTPPTAPNAPTLVTNTTGAPDQSGKVFANWAVSVTAPSPAVNFDKIFGSIRNNDTGEIALTAEWILDSGAYKTTIGRLQPITSHTVTVWAVNGNGLKGATATIGPTNTANYTTAQAAPAAPALVQVPGSSVQADIATPTYANHHRVEWQRKFGGGSYATIAGQNGARLVDHVGTSFGTWFYKARLIDAAGNVSGYSAESSILVSAQINDDYIVGLGVGSGSLNTGAVTNGKLGGSSVTDPKVQLAGINFNRLNIYNSSSTVTIGAGNFSGFQIGQTSDNQAFFPAITVGATGSADYQDIAMYAGRDVTAFPYSYVSFTLKNTHATLSRDVTVYFKYG